MNSLNDLLPDRPIKLLKTGKSSISSLVLFLIFVALLVGLWLWQAETLWRDFRMSRDYQVEPAAEVLGGNCRTRKIFFTDCEADIAIYTGGQARTEEVSFLFVAFDSDESYMVEPVSSPAVPGAVTISLALETIWSRIGFVGVLALMILAGIWAFGRAFLQARASARAARQASRLTVVPVQITNGQKTMFGTTLNYSYLNAAGKKKSSNDLFRKKEEPLVDNGGTALAVLPEGAAIPVLLDRGLRRIELTETERTEVHGRLGIAR